MAFPAAPRLANLPGSPPVTVGSWPSAAEEPKGRPQRPTEPEAFKEQRPSGDGNHLILIHRVFLNDVYNANTGEKKTGR